MPKVVTVTVNPALDMIVELPELVPETVNKARRERLFCGGKGLNVSLVLSLLGTETVACGFLGEDNVEAFRRYCRDHGIAFAFTLVPGSTRTNVKLAVDGRGATDINLPGLTPTADKLAALETALADLVQPGDWLALSGSLPPGIAPDFYSRTIDRFRAAGIKICLDASGPALESGLRSMPDLAKPNRDELLGLGGGNEMAAAEGWLTRGVGTMAVSLGGDGALLLDRNGERLRAGPAAVKAVNMVGAGDAFLAGMIHGRLQGWDSRRCLVFATALAGHWVEKMDRTVLDAARIEELCRTVAAEQLQG